jgi:predicted house-cleaning noncanonical NTP pyrophosphatase (MazG superfamily)
MDVDYLLFPDDKYDIQTIGVKAKNLIPHLLYTPDFIVLSANFYLEWKERNENFLKDKNRVLSDIAIFFQQKNHERIIIRSSCTSETINDRGKFLSKACKPNVNEIKEIIVEIFEDFENKKSQNQKAIALLIQVFVEPRRLAHLSNERRVNKSNLFWLLEEVALKDTPTRLTNIIIETPSNIYDQSLSTCLSSTVWLKNIETFASYFSGLENRFHFELLWDGNRFYLLQVDIESDYIHKGTKPGSAWSFKKNFNKQNSLESLEVFETVPTASGNWHKIQCVKTFEECKLPYWPIFILENTQTLKELSEGIVSILLITDLKKLLLSPIVIRTDTTSSDFMLPRTETIFTLEEAKTFLINKAKHFIEGGINPNQFSFLIHHFIASSACALSLTSPNTDITRVDSTWGIIEGLYYNTHDSFEFNHRDSKINRKIRCKSKYIDVKEDGKWAEKESGNNFDWRPSLTDEQIATIASYTQRISRHLKKTVNVMFFINNKKYYPEIIPWYYSTQEINETGTIHDNSLLSIRKTYFIKSKDDFEKLKKEYSAEKNISLYIDLNFDLSRDDIIGEIAKFAFKNNLTVDLKGSMLSHPYYVFKEKGVKVRCIDPFKSDYNSKKFYKLVRDKIPALIEGNNEKVITRKVDAEQLLVYLKEKIVEEANELHWSKSNEENIEEMADIYEVLRGFCKVYGIDIKEIEQEANDKREKRGGFDAGTVLIATKELSALKTTTEENKNLFQEQANNSTDIKVKLEPEIRFFQKGSIDNFRSLTEVNKINIPYVNEVASKSNSFRYKLKEGKYNAVTVEYEPKHIVITLETLNNELLNPSQLYLFQKRQNKK